MGTTTNAFGRQWKDRDFFRRRRRKRDAAKTAQIGAHGTDMYWPISAPISFCGQQGVCQTCGGKHAIALLAVLLPL